LKETAFCGPVRPMFKRALIGLVLGASLLATATMAAAEGADAPRSVWGTDNPGQGTSHSEKPLAGAEHNNAGADHTDNRGGGGGE
jgi:hypothetical protein